MIKKDGKNLIMTAKPSNVIIAELKNREACRNYRNCISGGFQYQNKANCILINNGKVYGNLSAHGWLGFPDTVLIGYKSGVVGVKKSISLFEEEIKQIDWAISGMGLLSEYAPAVEGYARNKVNGKIYDYSDVLRKTNHTAIGVKDGEIYGLYLANMTGQQVNKYCEKLGLSMAVLLDGGHIAAVNSDIYKANSTQKQHNIIQFVQE